MPRSVYILFASQYANKVDVDDTVRVRLKAFAFEYKLFRVVRIEPKEEDGEVVYLYYGTPVSSQEAR